MAHSPVNPNAACPDCAWPVVAVIGRVDVASLGPFEMDAKTGMYKRGVELVGPLCRCARCGAEFYSYSGKVHRWQEGVSPRENPMPTHSFANGTASQKQVFELARALSEQRSASLEGLASDDDDT